MKHARRDYDRLQDPEGLIPEDEPVFLLRGQDRLAAEIVEIYASDLAVGGGDPEMVAGIQRHAQAMRAWAAEHGKMPDVPEGAMR